MIGPLLGAADAAATGHDDAGSTSRSGPSLCFIVRLGDDGGPRMADVGHRNGYDRRERPPSALRRRTPSGVRRTTAGAGAGGLGRRLGSTEDLAHHRDASPSRRCRRHWRAPAGRSGASRPATSRSVIPMPNRIRSALLLGEHGERGGVPGRREAVSGIEVDTPSWHRERRVSANAASDPAPT